MKTTMVAVVMVVVIDGCDSSLHESCGNNDNDYNEQGCSSSSRGVTVVMMMVVMAFIS